MLTINERVIKAAKDAIRFFRHKPETNAYVVYAEDSRGCSDMDRIELLFLRDLYRINQGLVSDFTVYEYGHRGAIISEKWIGEMVDAEDAAKKEAQEAKP